MTHDKNYSYLMNATYLSCLDKAEADDLYMLDDMLDSGLDINEINRVFRQKRNEVREKNNYNCYQMEN